MADSVALRRFVRELTGDAAKSNRPVKIITGAPGAGKTTYVQQQRSSGDLVIDLDAIAAAIQGTDAKHPDFMPVIDEVMQIREVLYNAIEKRAGKWERAFVITSSPDKKRVTDLADRLNATVFEIRASLDECRERILNDSTRTNRERDILLAEQWFRQTR